MGTNITFYPQFGESGTTEDNFSFQEMAALYRGILRVWVGDGVTGDAGWLYAENVEGQIQKVGFVSDYTYAQSIGASVSYDEWVVLIKNLSEQLVQILQIATETDIDNLFST